MAYRQSKPRRRWTNERQARIAVLATGHASVGGAGPGRPVDASKPLAHATPTIKSDFARIGLSPLDPQAHDVRWSSGDAVQFDYLVRLRNTLGHGNEAGLRALLASKAVNDTVTWARGRMPVLNRYVRALDMLVWDHLVRSTGREPWS